MKNIFTAMGKQPDKPVEKPGEEIQEPPVTPDNPGQETNKPPHKVKEPESMPGETSNPAAPEIVHDAYYSRMHIVRQKVYEDAQTRSWNEPARIFQLMRDFRLLQG